LDTGTTHLQNMQYIKTNRYAPINSGAVSLLAVGHDPSNGCMTPLSIPYMVSHIRCKSVISSSKPSFELKSKTTKDNKGIVPSSGYIGDTRFDLLIPIFSKSLGEIFSPEELSTFINLTVVSHDKFIKNHGIIEGTAKWKVITTYATALLEGREPENPGWVSTGRKDKWPKALTHLRPVFHLIIDSIDNKDTEYVQTEARRFLNTLFKLNRVCSANKTLETLHELKTRFKLDPELLRRFEKFSREFLADVRDNITLSDISFELFLGPSHGPNGKPKLETASAEAAVLVKDIKLYSALKDMCVITNNNTFLSFVERIAQENKMVTDHILLRKITSIADKGNKARVIAICDFVTQSILAPVERIVVKTTMTLFRKQCCYYSHSQGWDDIQSQSEEVRQGLVSLDASAWTDNLPATLQYIVMKALFGQRLADAWYAFAVKCPWFVHPRARPITYGKGQGMGTKGSFAIAQLTDLIFVKFSLGELYPDSDDPYFMKVGDDLIVFDPSRKLRDRYEQIGVPINLTKSKFKTTSGTFTEFVSRNAWNGNDYSIVSPGLISKFLRNDHYGPTLFNHLRERDPTYPSFIEIFDMKKEILSKSKMNLDLLEDRTRTVVKLTTVLDIAEGTQLVEHPDDIWGDTSTTEILLFLENLILSTLGALVHASTQLMGDRNAKIARAKAELLLSRLSLLSDGDDLIDFIESNSMSLVEAAAAQEMISLARVSRTKYDKGINIVVPERTLLRNLDTCNSYIIEPESIQFLLKTQDKLGESVVGYKTTTRLSLFDKANTKTVLYLYRYLNGVLKYKTKALNLETGQYLLPYIKEEVYETLSVDLISQYANLFKFDVMLDQIEAIRQNENIDALDISFRTQEHDETSGTDNPTM